jgi:hypothetical protein
MAEDEYNGSPEFREQGATTMLEKQEGQGQEREELLRQEGETCQRTEGKESLSHWEAYPLDVLEAFFDNY